MADISSITSLDGVTYYLKDSIARPYVVTVTESDGVLITNASSEDIAVAVSNGKSVILQYIVDSTAVDFYQLINTNVFDMSPQWKAVFAQIYNNYSTDTLSYIFIDGTFVTHETKIITTNSEVPEQGGTTFSLVTTGEKYFWYDKQDALISGSTIKTINGNSILGSGNLVVSGLPSVTTTDNGKVLKVVNGGWEPSTGGSGLPSVTTTDNGKVLKVVDGEWEASTESSGLTNPGTLPSLTTTVSGEVLTITWNAGTLPS